ncbi:MAG: EpsD family peptidyl-prolyl cis-trans isomerase [Chakrabartia sp.]
MRKPMSGLILVGLLTSLAACDAKGSDNIPAGQTIARVDGQDVTIHELNAELKGVQLPSGDARKAVEQQALQRIIDRRILAGLARERKLDQSPEFVLLKERAEETVLVDLLQQNSAGQTKRPSQVEARNYVNANPSLFAGRTLLTLDQIIFALPKDPRKLKELVPIKSMTEVEKWLIDNGIQYRRQPAQRDTLQVEPAMAKRILALPPGEVFVVPAQGAAAANIVTNARVQPVPADQATTIALNILQGRAVMATATKELEAEVKKRREAVTYQSGFAPPKPAGKANAKPAAPVVPAKL